MKRALLIVSGLFLLAVIYLLVAPVPIDPVAWTPLPDTFGQGSYASNSELSRQSYIDLDDAAGPEDVHIDPDGTLTVGVADGRILRIQRGVQTTLARTGGRPLGLESDGKGGFWIADAELGLVHTDRTGQIEIATSSHDGLPFGFTDDLDVDRQGRVYFTDADHAWGHDQLKYAALEAAPNGRLLRYDPATKETTLVLDGLHFANGIALGPDERYLILTETLRLRVLKVWLIEDKFGEVEILRENLPGFPDNVTSAGGGAFWVALYAPRSAIKDAAMKSPFLRKVAARIPGAGLTRTRRHGMALSINHLGKVLHFMDDPSGAFAPVTTVREFNGNLYLGSLKEPRVARVTAPLRRR